MADLRVSDLPPLDAVDVEAVDPLLISDISASESKKIDVKSLTTAGVQLLNDGTIPSEKIKYPLPPDTVDGDAVIDNTLPGEKLEDQSLDGTQKLTPGSVDTDQLADGAVTDPKIARLAVTGGPAGAIALDSVTEHNLAPLSVGPSELQPIGGDSLIDLTITDEKIGDVDGSKINKDSIKAEQIAPDAITNSELGPDSVDSDNVIPESLVGGVDGDIAPDSITEYNLADDSVGPDQLQPISGDSIADGGIVNGKFAPSAADRGLDVSTGAIGHTNVVIPGLHNGLTFDDQGHITGTAPLLPTDLPIATEDDLGGVSIPADGGLSVSPDGALTHSNNITEDTVSGITYDAQGHIVNADPLTSADLPAASETELGAVYVPGPKLTIAGDGELTHAIVDGLVPDTYTKVSVDETGHVALGGALEGSDIPEHSADLITSGTLPVNQALDPEGNIFGDTLAIADNSITARHIRDYTSTLMQEENPGAFDRYGDPHFLGRYWYRPSTSQLHVYMRGSSGLLWQPVGFGVLTQQNLRFGGTYNGSTSRLMSVSTFGVQAGLSRGAIIPDASEELAGIYLICQEPGNQVTVPNVEAVDHNITDWIVCLGETSAWTHVDNSGIGHGQAIQVLNDLLDVSLNDGVVDARDALLKGVQPAITLQDGQLLKFSESDGMWRNTSILNCGEF